MPSGAVSVMPQAWMTVRPWRSKPSSIDSRHRRSADHQPLAGRDRSQRSGSASSAASIAIHTVGTPGRHRDPLVRAAGRARSRRPGVGPGRPAPRRRASRRRAVPRRWRGTSAPPAGSCPAPRRRAASGSAATERVQHQRAVRVHDALRPAGRARRVAHGRRAALVELGPLDRLAAGDQRLVVERPVRGRAVVGDDDHVLELACAAERLEHRQQRLVDDDRPVLRRRRRCRRARRDAGAGSACG